MRDKIFVDTNTLLYLLDSNALKAQVAEQLLRREPCISVQMLNEIANVARQKLGMTWGEINIFLTSIRVFCKPVSLTVETHDRGRAITERYGFGLHDAMIVAAALLGGYTTLYTEGMQDGLCG